MLRNAVSSHIYGGHIDHAYFKTDCMTQASIDLYIEKDHDVMFITIDGHYRSEKKIFLL